MVSAILSRIAGAILLQILCQIPVCVWDYLSRDQPSSSNNVGEHKTMQSEEINQDQADTGPSKGRKRLLSSPAEEPKRHRVSSPESLPLAGFYFSPVQLEMLTRIELKKPGNCSRLPPAIGSLPFLENLKLKKMDTITIESDDMATTIFPSLKKLKLIKLASISFEGMSLSSSSSFSSSSSSSTRQPGSRKLFPLLRKLIVNECDVVSGLPWSMLSQLSELYIRDSRGLDDQLPGCLNGLKSLDRLMIIGSKRETLFDSREVMATLERLENVTVGYCNELISVDGLQVLPSLASLRISSCPKLRRWWVEGTSEQQQQGVLLSKLSQIDISYCKALESLPAWLPLLPSLESLTITNCPKVRSLPEGGLPSSLRKLEIDPGLKECCQQELLSNPEWQMIQEQEYIIFERKRRAYGEE